MHSHCHLITCALRQTFPPFVYETYGLLEGTPFIYLTKYNFSSSFVYVEPYMLKEISLDPSTPVKCI